MPGPVGVLAASALGLAGAESNRGKGGLDGVGGAQVDPVLSGEVEVGEQHVLVLDQLPHGLAVLGWVGLLAASQRRLGGLLVLRGHDLVQSRLGLQALGQGIDDVGDLVHPATLLLGIVEDHPGTALEAWSTVPDRQHRGLHAPPLQIAQHVGPGFPRFSEAVPDCYQFLAPVRPHPDQDQAAEPVLLKPAVEVSAVGPRVDVVTWLRSR